MAERRPLGDIPYFEVSGTYYEVGYQIGERCRAGIIRFHEGLEGLRETVLPFIESDFGRTIYGEFLEACQRSYPEYVTELRGLADGALVDFTSVFAINIMNELTAFADEQVTSSGCTCVHVNNAETYAFAHNEDSDENLDGDKFLVSVTIYDDSDEERRVPIEKFTCLYIAGYLSGIAPSFNQFGMAFCANSLRPKTTLRKRIPKTFIYRALLRTKSFDDVIDIVTAEGKEFAQGTSINVGCTHALWEPMTWNIETLHPEDYQRKTRVSVLRVTREECRATDGVCCPGVFLHCNRYLRLDVDQIEDDCHVISSGSRHERLREFKPLKSTTDMLEFLSDDHNPKYPVYRKVQETDGKIRTVSTVLFDMKNAKMDVYVGKSSNPANRIYSLDIPRTYNDTCVSPS